MRSINKTTILGNIGADVEVRQMNNGVSVANLSVATSESWKDRNTGEVIERTEWHRVVLFGKLAEIAGQYLGKGSKVYIEGRMQTREWEKDGIKRYTTEIIVDQRGSMVMLDKPEQGQQPAAQQAAPQPARQRPAPQPVPAQADAENWDAYDPLPY